MALGKVLRFDEVHGYGFILPDDGGPDVFLHVNDFAGPESLLSPGAYVEFDVDEGSRGPKASAVRLAGPKPAAEQRTVTLTRSDGDRDEEVYFDVLSAADFKVEMTEALLQHVRTLTAEQVVQVRDCILALVQGHDWVDG